MKYRLSTILLLITCVALALGWYLDRYKRNTDQLVKGSFVRTRAATLRSLGTAPPTEIFSEKVATKQVKCVCKVFSSAKSIRQANRVSLGELDRGLHAYTPLMLAAGLLKASNCTSADQYFDRFKLLEPGPGGRLADYKPGGEQHKAFRQFVEKALKQELRSDYTIWD